MFKDFVRKRLFALIAGSLSAVLVNVFQAKLGLDPAAATDLADKMLLAVAAYIGGQSLTDAIAINKGTKAS